MAQLLSSQSEEMLNVLSDQFGKLEGGSMEIGGFRDWFKSVRWDSSKGFNTTEMAPLGWAIETSLFEYDQYPDAYTLNDLRDCIAIVVKQQGLEGQVALLTELAPKQYKPAEATGVSVIESIHSGNRGAGGSLGAVATVGEVRTGPSRALAWGPTPKVASPLHR